jgi:hypothetical protein
MRRSTVLSLPLQLMFPVCHLGEEWGLFTVGPTALSITTFSMLTLSIKTLSILTFSIATRKMRHSAK